MNWQRKEEGKKTREKQEAEEGDGTKEEWMMKLKLKLEMQ